MRKWNGTVLSVQPDYFTVDLHEPLTGEELEADFPVSLVSEHDFELLRPGAVVYLTVRTIFLIKTQPTRTATITFRRLGQAGRMLNEDDRLEAAAIAEDLQNLGL